MLRLFFINLYLRWLERRERKAEKHRGCTNLIARIDALFKE